MNTNKFLKNSIIVGLFLVPFIPLIVTNSLFFPFITGKGFAFRILVGILAALWLVLALRDPAFRPKRSWIAIAIPVFALITLVADLAGSNVGKSLWSNFERMEGWITIIHLLLYFFVASAVFTTRKIWDMFFNTSLGVSAVLCIYGFLQLAHKLPTHQSGTRLDATLGNSAYLAVVMLVSSALTVFMLVRAKTLSVAMRWAYGTLLFAQLIILYYTGTRGSILGLIIGGVLWAVLTLIFEKGKEAGQKRVRMAALYGLISIVVIIGGFELVKNTHFVQTSPVLSRLASISYHDAAPRLAIWKMALKGFEEKPILGWGQENFNFVFNKYYDPSIYSQEQWFDRAHNVFFDWLIAGGLLGLLSYLSLFAVALWHLWKKYPHAHLSLQEKIVLTSLFAAYMIHNLFVFDNLASYILFFSLLAFIHAMSAPSKIAFFEKIKLDKEIMNIFAVPIVVIVLIGALYFANIKPIRASDYLIEAISQQKNLSVNIDYFNKALALNTFADQEIREQLVATARQVIDMNNADQSVKQAFFNLTQKQLTLGVSDNPEDARGNYFLGSFLSRVGLYDQALPYLQKAVALSPTKQTILFELGSLYINMKQYPQALEVYKKAFDLDPTYDDARLMYAATLIYNGQDATANQVLQPLFDKGFVIDERFAPVYLATKNYAKLIDIYKQAYAKDPTNPQRRITLAAAYLAAGNRDAAVAQLQALEAENPPYKAQADYYIKEIRAGRNP